MVVTPLDTFHLFIDYSPLRKGVRNRTLIFELVQSTCQIFNYARTGSISRVLKNQKTKNSRITALLRNVTLHLSKNLKSGITD